jgi:hypothetical protein
MLPEHREKLEQQRQLYHDQREIGETHRTRKFPGHGELFWLVRNLIQNFYSRYRPRCCRCKSSIIISLLCVAWMLI